ncbi:MAG: NAD-dependent deacylase [Candidatus Cloacimonetes bacterium]|nr:NAD-dependent deacylase [Candidatus Cloacimonadota bacterium]
MEGVLNLPPAPTLTDFLTVLTGAGVSAESGIRTFRDAGGLWESHRLEEVASPPAFARDPELVWRFYKARWENASRARPNPAHEALAAMGAALAGRFVLITQNVDGLHQCAGSAGVLDMHGSLHRCRCTRCDTHYSMRNVDLTPALPACPACGGLLRPDIVWFGEMPHYLDEIEVALRRTTLFLVAGTSGVVYPAAQFVQMARRNGASAIGVNLEPPDNIACFDTFIQGRAGVVLPQLAAAWLDADKS